MPRSAVIVVPLSSRHAARLIGGVAIGCLAVVLGTYWYHRLVPDPASVVGYLWREINLTGERNFAVWFASMLLLAICLAMSGCFVLDRRQATAARDRMLSFGWLGLSAVFATLSLDEMASLHERIGLIEALNIAPSHLGTWIGVFAIPIAVVGAFILTFSWVRMRQAPAAFTLLALAVLLFLSVPLLEHFREGLSAQIEEVVELVACLGFLSSALLFALRVTGGNSRRVYNRRIEVPFNLGNGAGSVVVTILGLAMLVVWIGVPASMKSGDTWGDLLTWFPAALSFLVMLVSFYLALGYWRGGDLRSAVPLFLLAILHLLLSMDHGSSHQISNDLWSAQPGRRTLVDMTMAAGMAAVALTVIPRPVTPVLRAALAAWLLFLVSALAVGEPLIAPLSFVGYGVLFPALLTLLPASPGPPRRHTADGD